MHINETIMVGTSELTIFQHITYTRVYSVAITIIGSNPHTHGQNQLSGSVCDTCFVRIRD